MFQGIVTGKLKSEPFIEEEPGSETCEVVILRSVFRQGKASQETVYLRVPTKRIEFLKRAYRSSWSVVFVVFDVVAHAIPNQENRVTPYLFFNCSHCDLA